MSRLVRLIENGMSQMKLSHNYFGQPHPHNQPFTKSVRWYRPRKPFWLPKAKSKIFRIPVKPVIPKEEWFEIKRLYNVYKTQMKSLQAYFKEYLMTQTTAPEVIAEREQKKAEQHAWCIKENESWNAEVAKLREKRLAIEAEEREKNILNKIIEHETRQQELIKELDEHIRKEKEAAKSFITPDNIDEAIENTLKNVVDYNFCIDLEGNIYTGRYGKPSTPINKKTSVSPATVEDEAQLEARS